MFSQVFTAFIGILLVGAGCASPDRRSQENREEPEQAVLRLPHSEREISGSLRTLDPRPLSASWWCPRDPSENLLALQETLNRLPFAEISERTLSDLDILFVENLETKGLLSLAPGLGFAQPVRTLELLSLPVERACVWLPEISCLAVSLSLPLQKAGAASPSCLQRFASLPLPVGRVGENKKFALIRRAQHFITVPARLFSVLVFARDDIPGEGETGRSLASALIQGPPVASILAREPCPDSLGSCLISPIPRSLCVGCENLDFEQIYDVYLVREPGEINSTIFPVAVAGWGL